MPIRRPQSSTDCALRRARSDPEAFAEFYDAYSRQVLSFLARRVVSAEVAFDLTSESFAVALEHVGKFRGNTPGEEQAWIFSIARRQAGHYWRRGRVEQRALTRLGVPAPSLTSEEIERIERLAGIEPLRLKLAEALEQLPTDQRDAVQLRVVDDLHYPEVAARMGVSEQTARARVSRGLRTLRGHIAGDDGILEISP